MITEDPVADADYTDHEVSMAKSQLLSSMKSVVRIAKNLKDKSESEGIEGWVASKITMAEDYLQAVADYMDGQEINEGFKIRDKSRGYGVADKTYKTREEAKKAATMKAAMTGGDWEVIEEGYKVMPPMDPKYVARKGLEGPFSTLSGKVVYYDPKEGKYYDPDTDMYLSYDEFQNYDKDYSGMKDERDEVKEADETKYGIIRYPDTAISYIKNDGNGWEHIFDKSYGFKGPVDKADLKYAKKIAKEKIPSRMFGMNEEEDPYASQTIMDEDPPLGINYDYANLPKVDWDKYSTKAIKEFLSVIENLDFESGYYGDVDDFDDTHFNAAQWIEKNVLAKRQDESVKESSEALTEEQFDEAAGEKDACYHKVKSRYKVWPSAYASGALVKCRKVGAKNWGNSKKK